MKSTGIVRKVDELGRITLPIELRRTLGIEERAPLEIFIDDKTIMLMKYQEENDCQKCHSKEKLKHNGRVCLCSSCLEEFK